MRNQSWLAIAMIDIDHFKLYNDHYGHPTGDRCLRLVADALTRNVADRVGEKAEQMPNSGKLPPFVSAVWDALAALSAFAAAGGTVSDMETSNFETNDHEMDDLEMVAVPAVTAEMIGGAAELGGLTLEAASHAGPVAIVLALLIAPFVWSVKRARRRRA